MAALGLSPSRTFKKPSEPKAAILIPTRSFSIMKEIQLTQGKITEVDDDDYEYISGWKWHYSGGYAVRSAGIWPFQHKVFMHRVIMNTPDGMDTDHKDLNRLNNKKENLRNCTRSENRHNQKISKNNTSGYKGVCWNGRGWLAQIKSNGKKINLGTWKTKEDAAMAYDEAAKKYFGEFANTNF
jgi:hypothetical protein